MSVFVREDFKKNGENEFLFNQFDVGYRIKQYTKILVNPEELIIPFISQDLDKLGLIFYKKGKFKMEVVDFGESSKGEFKLFWVDN